ncbi:MAG: Asp-tRNA(Asn)/Glu-tRNA(Gln) amidotransferase subunit GatC [Halobacteriota archaeon]|nr:Asp-tRNA(Asn)/Glu-tRNA(Gln) amidotransferase subunit GatC [Halobacteriota archaeon]
MITKKEIEHIGWLARIELTDGEKNEFTEQMNSVLEYFSTLDRIDTDLPPTHHVLGIINVFRDDVAKDSLKRDDVLNNAPKKEGSYIKGPRIV